MKNSLVYLEKTISFAKEFPLIYGDKYFKNRLRVKDYLLSVPFINYKFLYNGEEEFIRQIKDYDKWINATDISRIVGYDIKEFFNLSEFYQFKKEMHDQKICYSDLYFEDIFGYWFHPYLASYFAYYSKKVIIYKKHVKNKKV